MPRVAPIAAPQQVWGERSRVVAVVALRKSCGKCRCLVVAIAIAATIAVAAVLPWRWKPLWSTREQTAVVANAPEAGERAARDVATGGIVLVWVASVGAGQRVSAWHVAARRVDGVAAGCVATGDSTVGGVTAGIVAADGEAADGSAVVGSAKNRRMCEEGPHGGQ